MQSVTPFTGRSGCLRWSRRALTCARPRRCVTVGPADTPFKTVVWYWCVYLLNVIITHLSLTQPSTTPPSPPIFFNFIYFCPPSSRPSSVMHWLSPPPRRLPLQLCLSHPSPHLASFLFRSLSLISPTLHPPTIGPRTWSSDSGVMCTHWAPCHENLFCQTHNERPRLLLMHG